MTVLKKFCRKFKVPRWPYRKLKSMEKLIASVEDYVARHNQAEGGGGGGGGGMVSVGKATQMPGKTRVCTSHSTEEQDSLCRERSDPCAWFRVYMPIANPLGNLGLDACDALVMCIWILSHSFRNSLLIVGKLVLSCEPATLCSFLLA